MSVNFDINLIKKYQVNTPRYTSYPTADKFNHTYNLDKHIDILKQLSINHDEYSLYVHIPFCNTLCLFCGCNKIITNKRDRITKYINYLEREIILLYNHLGCRRVRIDQLHFGGGSPSWLHPDEITYIMSILNKYFDYSTSREIAMEVDPRHTDSSYIQHLKNLGFNRISLGVQDFDIAVQKAVNRIQPYNLTKNILSTTQKLNFESTSVDLIYGLPFQSVESFSNTILEIIKLKPDRISLFNYAHIPNVIMSQTRINQADLPSGDVKLAILELSVNYLTNAGYVFIGMDHFALSHDSLAIALSNGTMQRNFQGYSTHANLNLLGIGISSIGMLNNNYYQNYKTLDEYYVAIDNNQLPIYRGFVVNDDDIIRKYVIHTIMCQFKLIYQQLFDKYQIKFCDYFVSEINKLQDLAQDGLIVLDENGFYVTNSGRFLVRNIAVIFDKYYQLEQNKIFSKAI